MEHVDETEVRAVDRISDGGLTRTGSAGEDHKSHAGVRCRGNTRVYLAPAPRFGASEIVIRARTPILLGKRIVIAARRDRTGLARSRASFVRPPPRQQPRQIPPRQCCVRMLSPVARLENRQRAPEQWRGLGEAVGVLEQAR